jgi:S1-C subfamily serine protease/thioredoxin-related protein
LLWAIRSLIVAAGIALLVSLGFMPVAGARALDEQDQASVGVVGEQSGLHLPSIFTHKSLTTSPRPTAEFGDWIQDLDTAKNRAAEEKKDLLILFTHSDEGEWSTCLAREVLLQAEFREQAARSFVLVFVDFPTQALAKSKVQDAARNSRLRKQHLVKALPTLVLADAQGRPYAFSGYRPGGVNAYLAHLEEMEKIRRHRDRILLRIERVHGLAKLYAARDVLTFLEENRLSHFYEPLLHDWVRLAGIYDSQNKQGFVELFFAAEWQICVSHTDATDFDARAKYLARLDDWKKVYRFKDQNCAARLHLIAADLEMRAQEYDPAWKLIQQGLAYEPTNPQLRYWLFLTEVRLCRGTGTGFIVAPGGYIMTNHHVISGPGRIMVLVPGVKDLVPADIVAADPEGDLALLRIALPAGIELKPLGMAAQRQVRRGEPVAALGYPLSPNLGLGLKLTTGVVCAAPDWVNAHALLVDAKVNPGNSGGPLCDASGQVVGMITMKSHAEGTMVESYGLALSAQAMDGFLRKHLSDYSAVTAGGSHLTWDEVDRLVSASVVMIVRTR